MSTSDMLSLPVLCAARGRDFHVPRHDSLDLRFVGLFIQISTTFLSNLTKNLILHTVDLNLRSYTYSITFGNALTNHQWCIYDAMVQTSSQKKADLLNDIALLVHLGSTFP